MIASLRSGVVARLVTSGFTGNWRQRWMRIASDDGEIWRFKVSTKSVNGTVVNDIVDKGFVVLYNSTTLLNRVSNSHETLNRPLGQRR